MAEPFSVPQGGGNRSMEAGEQGKSAMAMSYKVMVSMMVTCTTAKLYRATKTLVTPSNAFSGRSRQAFQPS